MLDPARALVRRRTRQALVDPSFGPPVPPGALVLAAVSGGPDSTALADALAAEGPRLGVRAGAVVVDHGLQPGSDAVAARVADLLVGMGLDPVVTARVVVSGPGGPEAAARAARYRALEDAVSAHGAAAVLLGHTRDDQAETVLLGLARGSGARSLAGMPGASGCFRRPLLDVGRQTTRAACAAAALPVWDDPHNADPAYARVRVRQSALPALEAALGPGVTEALARTADQLRDDDAALDGWARRVLASVTDVEGALDPVRLRDEPAAVRRRVLRLAVLAAGVPGGSLSCAHLAAVDALVDDWRGQGPVSLPGGVEARRACGRLVVGRP